MDFLHDFRSHARSNRQEAAAVKEQTAAWKPTTEVVLARDHLTSVGTVEVAAPDAPPAPAQSAPAPPPPVAAPPPPVAAPPTSAPSGSPPSPGWAPPSSGGPGPAGWAPPAYPPPTPAFTYAPYPNGPKRRRGMVLVAVGAALALVLGSGAFLVNRQLKKASYPKAWDPRVASIAGFVARERGLAWKHPVYVGFQPQAQFARQLVQGGQFSQRQQSGLEALRAFGLVWGNVDASKLTQQIASNDVDSFYDPTRHTIYVKGESLAPSVQVMVAYELDQALLDQYFDLQRLQSGSADDEGAVSALVAGDADRVQAAFMQSLPNAEQQALAQELQQAATSAKRSDPTAGVPQFLVDQLSFPDDFGTTFVTVLLKEGGTAELNAAYKDPPTLDGQVIDASLYEPGLSVPSVRVPSAPPGSRVIVPPAGFGEIPLVEMLGDAMGFQAAWDAVKGWSADQGQVYVQSGRTCAALAVLDETASDAQVLGRAGLRWAQHLPGASASVSGRVVDFRSCDPGTGWRPAAASPDPYQALSAREFWIGSLVSQTDMNVVTATCVVDALMAAVGPGTLQAARDGNGGGPAGSQVAQAVPKAAASCGYIPPSSPN